jgi:hypothetical protein
MISKPMTAGLGALFATAALVGAAQAGPVQQPAVAIALEAVARPAPAPGQPLPVGYRPAETPLPEGVARTSVDHRFARDGSEDYVGAAGLLCGLKPGADLHGAAAAYGSDPDGKFVGAKFTIAF